MSVVLTATYGWTVERLAYRPLRGSSRLAPLISAIGMSIFLQNYVQLLQGARNKPLQPIISGGMTVMEGNGFAVQLSYLQIVIMVVTVVLLAAFTLMISRTFLERAQRACDQAHKMASLTWITSTLKHSPPFSTAPHLSID